MTQTPKPQPLAPRVLGDDTLVVFVSDTHIGGDVGHTIFETPAELAALFDELARHAGPVELIIAGDLFDFLLLGSVPKGENRASATLSRPEYRTPFAALERLAAGNAHVVCLPGNHDAELWWNREVQRTLLEAGLIHEFRLSYTAYFASAPERLIYCEHGNEFDPANAKTDYSDPLDTPLGDHIVADAVRRIGPRGRVTNTFDLRDVSRVFPLVTIPDWLIGRIFYTVISRVTTYLLLPLLLGYLAYRFVALLLAGRQGTFWIQNLFVQVAWDAALLVVVFLIFFVMIKRAVNRAGSSTASLPGAAQVDASAEKICNLLQTDKSPPLEPALSGREIAVFVSGHTHAPSLTRLARSDVGDAVAVNSGCWLRQLRPVHAHFGGPPVFVSTFVQTHVRVFLTPAGLCVELWEYPKPAPQHLPVTERLAVLGRLPTPPKEAAPRVYKRETLPGVR